MEIGKVFGFECNKVLCGLGFNFQNHTIFLIISPRFYKNFEIFGRGGPTIRNFLREFKN